MTPHVGDVVGRTVPNHENAVLLWEHVENLEAISIEPAEVALAFLEVAEPHEPAFAMNPYMRSNPIAVTTY